MDLAIVILMHRLPELIILAKSIRIYSVYPAVKGLTNSTMPVPYYLFTTLLLHCYGKGIIWRYMKDGLGAWVIQDLWMKALTFLQIFNTRTESRLTTRLIIHGTTERMLNTHQITPQNWPVQIFNVIRHLSEQLELAGNRETSISNCQKEKSALAQNIHIFLWPIQRGLKIFLAATSSTINGNSMLAITSIWS